MMPLFRSLLLGIVLLGTGCGATEEDKPNDTADSRYGVEQIRLGADGDVDPALHGPSLMLQGDGSPLDTAFQAHVNHVADAPLDVVVLAASFPSGQSPTPECDRIVELQHVHSCETITIPEPQGADLDDVASTVKRAEVVYFAGGNQCNYVKWEGSAVHTAVKDVVADGGGVGGGSAGLAIQGDVAYDGCTGSVRSEEALNNPYHSDISFTATFFDWPLLNRLITDSHFAERDRMGRLIVFIARQIKEQDAEAFYGLGVNEATAVVIDSSGQGQVYGERAYLVHGDHPAETLSAGVSLTYSDVSILQLSTGMTYDFSERPLDGAYQRSVEEGTLSADPY